MLRHDTRQKVGPATLFPQSAATYNPQHVSGGCYIRPVKMIKMQGGVFGAVSDEQAVCSHLGR